MGLYAWEIEKIVKLGIKPPFKTLSFGHPDILATPGEIEPILGVSLPIDNQYLDRRFKPQGEVGNARLVFGVLGSQMTILEYRDTYNIDGIVDLNYPLTPNLLGKFDLVIDPGTSEHCFNVGQALLNMAGCLKPGGHVYHRVPLCHWNHGFWNFSPCVFHDFYTKNGFVIKTLAAESGGKFEAVQLRKGGGPKWFSPRDGRKWQLVCIAQRQTSGEIVFPIQGKYA